MANHKSCEKKARVNERRHKENLNKILPCKANIRKFKKETDVNKAVELLNTIKKQLDKVGGKHIFHKNKVNRLKSRYEKMVNNLKSKNSQNTVIS